MFLFILKCISMEKKFYLMSIFLTKFFIQFFPSISYDVFDKLFSVFCWEFLSFPDIIIKLMSQKCEFVYNFLYMKVSCALIAYHLSIMSNPKNKFILCINKRLVCENFSCEKKTNKSN